MNRFACALLAIGVFACGATGATGAEKPSTAARVPTQPPARPTVRARVFGDERAFIGAEWLPSETVFAATVHEVWRFEAKAPTSATVTPFAGDIVAIGTAASRDRVLVLDAAAN